MTELVPVTRDYLEKVWPLVQPLAEQAQRYSRGTWSPASFLDQAFRDEAQLWLAAEHTNIVAAMGTSIDLRYDGRRLLQVLWVAGSGFSEWEHHIDRVKAWAKERGCSAVEYQGRRGWQRRRREARVVGIIYEEAL